MCGIAGWIGSGDPRAALDDVVAAGRVQAHRGPDGDGLLVLAPQCGVGYLSAGSRRVDVPLAAANLPFGVVVAHQRLAILDLGPTGAQPMGSADGRIWLAYNGEIYNYLELKAELETSCGHVFRGRSDTEVLLAAYERWGTACLERLQGMFAFVIVDLTRGCVVLARDHLGQKPLFVRRVRGGIAFASEIPALLRISPSPVRTARDATVDFLATGRTDHRTDTMIEGVSRIDPGTATELFGPGASERSTRRFWEPPEPARVGIDLETSARRLREIFDRSITWHRRSDVPVATLLSGGTDSSAALLAQRRLAGDAADLHAVSYIGGAGSISEEPWIDAVVDAARCRSSKLRLEQGVWADPVTVARYQGEPMGGPAILVHHALCRFARAQGVKVLLAGHGADELLAGYPSALPLRVAALVRRGNVLAASKFLFAAASGSARQMLGTASQAARVLVAPRQPMRGWPWLAVADHVTRRAIVDYERPRTLAALVRRYLRTSLPAILRWEDRNTMAASLEGRLPYLLPEFVSYCLALPEHVLVGPSGETKYVLRNAVRDLLPAAVTERRLKVGLSVPVEAWARENPDVARRLARSGEIPGVDAKWVRGRAEDLHDGRPLPVRDLYAVWRLVGLDVWREALDVEFSS